MKIKRLLARVLWKVHKRLGRLAEKAHRRYLQTPPPPPQPPYVPQVCSREQRAAIKEALCLSFCGDLILLRDMVENARQANGGYDFSPMFQWVSPYWKEADLAVGVFEGPMAGEAAGYSTSRLGDGVPLYLNFPDEYASSVKEAGIGLVSTAHNHVLDKGVEAIPRTLEVLEKAGLQHFGSNRSNAESERVKVICLHGVKIAFLGFTYGSNYYQDDYFFSPEHRHETRKLVDQQSPFIEECKNAVAADFQRAKAQKPDLIVAMPHMGEEFRHQPDEFQLFWVDFLVKQGADIIMADHPHCVQPVEWRKLGGKDVLISYCPGNLLSSAIGRDGDASMLVEVYVDRQTHRPVAAGIVPLYAYSQAYLNHGAGFCALPIYDALSTPELQERLSRRDELRIKEALHIITKSALGVDLQNHCVERRYLTFPGCGYRRNPVPALPPADLPSESPMVHALQQAGKVLFIGDDVTSGISIGGLGWHEPLTAAFPHLSTASFVPEHGTALGAAKQAEEISAVQADVYVIALGMQDICKHAVESCAMTGEDYIHAINSIVSSISAKQPQSRIMLLTPWASHPCDRSCPLAAEEKQALHRTFCEALLRFAKDNNLCCIDPNPYIDFERSARFWEYYMLNQTLPNAQAGVPLYARAVVHSQALNR